MAETIRPAVKRKITPTRELPGHRWLLRGYFLLLFCAPLPLGSNRPWAWGVMECWVFLLLTVWLIQRWLHQPLKNPFQDLAIRPFRPAMVLWLLVALYPLWQTIPWPDTLLPLLSPTTTAVRQLVGITPQGSTISLDPHLTLVEWLKGMAYLGIFWLTLVLPKTRKAIRQLTWVILASGMVQVSIHLLSLDGTPAQDIHGSFVNRNHLAGFLELVLPVAIGLLRSTHQARGSMQGWQDHLHHGLHLISGLPGLFFGITLAMVITLFLTQSRGGNGSLLLALFLVATLPRIRDPGEEKSSPPWVRIGVIVLTVAFLVSNSVGLGSLTERYLDTNVQREGRLAVLMSATGIIQDYPLFGSGSGTFGFVYPRYQPEVLSQTLFDHAHNDHLEWITDRGLVGYGLVVIALLHCWWMMARAHHTRQDPLASALLYASLVGTLSLVLHGLTDFNFQIPANALYFMVILAMGLRGVHLTPANRHVV